MHGEGGVRAQRRGRVGRRQRAASVRAAVRRVLPHPAEHVRVPRRRHARSGEEARGDSRRGEHASPRHDQQRRGPAQEEKLRGDAESDGGAGEQGVARRGVVAQRARHQHQRQHAERKVDDLRGPDGVALQRQRREEVRPDAGGGEPRRGFAKENARQHDRRDDHQREGDGVRREAEGVELQRGAPGDERDGRAEELHWDAGVIDVERRAAVQDAQALVEVDRLGVVVESPERPRMHGDLVDELRGDGEDRRRAGEHQ